MRILLGAALLLVSCSYSVTNDYIDFVKANGISYIAVDYFGGGTGVGRALVEADLGPEHLRVKQMLSGATKGADYRIADGDSAYVGTGDPVYAVKGYATTFRLAARHDGRLVLYEADSNPAAKAGRDLLDIDGKVVRIALISGKDGRTVLGRMSDRSRIDELVRLVLAAPVDQNPPSSSPSRPRTPLPVPTPTFETPDYGFSVAFQLADGTATQRNYDIAIGVLHRGISVAGAFRTAVQELAAAAPTPTAAPAFVNLAQRYDLARATKVTIKGPQFVQDGALIPRFAAALDADLPATRSTVRAVDGPIVIFEFGTDHIVSLAFDRVADLVRVVVPDDELAVRPNPEFRAILDTAR